MQALVVGIGWLVLFVLGSYCLYALCVFGVYLFKLGDNKKKIAQLRSYWVDQHGYIQRLSARVDRLEKKNNPNVLGGCKGCGSDQCDCE